MREATQEVLTKVRELPDVPRDLEAGRDRPHWAAALEDVDWDDGDVLVVGSSALGPVARVFLGSRATKIVRHSPCPWSLSRARLVRASKHAVADGRAGSRTKESPSGKHKVDQSTEQMVRSVLAYAENGS